MSANETTFFQTRKRQNSGVSATQYLESSPFFNN